jgi:hypothetical protein
MSPGRALFAGDRSTFRGSRSHWRKRSESTDLIPVVSEKRFLWKAQARGGPGRFDCR